MNRNLLRLLAFEVAAITIAGALILTVFHRRAPAPDTVPTAAVTASPTPGVSPSAAAPATEDGEIPDHEEVVEEAASPEPTPMPPPPMDLKRLLAKKLKVVEHTVKMGENYWTVAKQYDVDVPTLVGANPDMPFVSRVKQVLNVPDRKGVLHVAAKGETPDAIAKLYETKPEEIRKENALSWWRGLREGDVLFIAGAKPVRMNEQWKGYFEHRGIFGVPFASWGRGWSSKFGVRHDPLTGEKRMHRGMDFRAKYGADVFAAATGKVIFAGVSGGYGNLIQVAHANGYLTYYGHLSKIFVHAGQHVRRGQRIGKVGATGRVTGPHLHFEIRKNGKAINPLPLI